MGIYLTPEFDQDRKVARISDKILCKAAGKIFEGLRGDHLGKHTYKKRLQLPGVSASDGARSIVFFNDGENVYFFDMYLKSELSKKKGKELEDDEIDAYCKLAPGFVSMKPEKIAELIEIEELIEVKCDE
ncbi:type II toxin-antitoxin system RelE/ParE family toxin [Pantoea cypripedii]|uniref:type II toxin-antitoxin system RelE/ParE family toxin n=1 Tax=Pantoea cypripedii TaxID=55209 RepID=UPI002FCC96FF